MRRTCGLVAAACRAVADRRTAAVRRTVAARRSAAARRTRASRTRGRGLLGQASVEFVIVFPLLIFCMFMIMWAGYSFYERATLTNQLSQLGSELPDGWESMTDQGLVRELILDGTTMDPDALTVVFASVNPSAPSVSTKDNDPVARSLGLTSSRVSTQTLTVTATVEYRFTDLWSFWGSTTARNTVTRTYLIGQKHEYT